MHQLHSAPFMSKSKSKSSSGSSGGGGGAARGVSFASDVAAGPGASSPAASLQSLLALQSDQARLENLKAFWDKEGTRERGELVREAGKEVDKLCKQYVDGTGAVPSALFSSLRSLLGLVSLLARREYPAENKKESPVPLEVFPGVVQNLLLLLEAPERPLADAAAATASSAASASPAPMRSVLKFSALHAFNRLLEAFPSLLQPFAPLVAEWSSRELGFIIAQADSASAAAAASYSSKVVETLGLVAATFPSAIVPHSHMLLKQLLQLLQNSLKTNEAAAAASASSSSSSPVSAALTPLQELVINLVHLSALLLRKMHVRLPLAYPSARYLHPRSWPFGSEEHEESSGGGGAGGAGGGGDDDEEAGDDERENGVEDDAGGEDEGDELAPRPCFTEAIPLAPARKGVQPLILGESPSASGTFLSTLVESLLNFHSAIGVEREGSSVSMGVVNDSGVTILAFLPLLVALDNQRVGTAARAEQESEALEQHGALALRIAEFAVAQLQELDFSAFSPSLASSSHQYLLLVEGAFKYSRRLAVLPGANAIYNDLVNWLSDASGSFPRAGLIKLRRFAVAAFLAVMYTLDTTFQEEVGSATFFKELFPLVASPLLTSHLIWLLRQEREHTEKKVLPQVMRGLLNTKTRSSPSAKTVNMILQSLGNVACFSRAFGDAALQQNAADAASSSAAASPAVAAPGSATLPLLAPYMSQLLETVVHTMENSPTDMGQTASLVLCRIVMAGYDMPEVQSSLPVILRLFLRVLDERIFISQAAAEGDEYDENDVDIVGQVQYCVLDMMHLWMQPAPSAAAGSAADASAHGYARDAAPHPFFQSRFVTLLAEDASSLRALRKILALLLANTTKPLIFASSDEAALRNSEIHLLQEMCAHKKLFDALVVKPAPEGDDDGDEDEAEDGEDDGDEEDGSAQALPPLPPEVNPASLVLTLLRAIQLAQEDGHDERVYHYRGCLSSLAAVFASQPAALAAMRSSLQAPEQAQLVAQAKRDAETWKVVQTWASTE